MAALARWRADGLPFRHRGQPIFVREAGAAIDQDTSLLCLHGFPTASNDWYPIWDGLVARFGHVLAFDMLGYGFSAKPAGQDYPIGTQADIAEALLRDRGVRRVHLLAHDVGDTVAQELLARDGERRAIGDRSLEIASCVLLNGGLFPETHRASRAQKLLLSRLGPLVAATISEKRFMPNFALVFGPQSKPSAEELQVYWALLAHDNGHRRLHRLIRYILERRANRDRWVGALQRTVVPLHLIDGARDPISGAHMVERFRELIPNPDVTLLPEVGHYPQTEAPEAVLDAVLRFHERLQGR
ncbi:MAG: alpha/beta hydrolase [Xanthomonadaceae bacterium]|nr:alpha/beta hydrolase [Xanthomonadaceae bacterium]